MLKLSKYPHGGFTLIELLVVVLIIGILAAIALPQYKAVVDKANWSTMLDAVRALRNEQNFYYLINGSYATNISDLSGSFPGDCTENGDCTKFSLSLGNGYVFGSLKKSKVGIDNALVLWPNGVAECYAYSASGARGRKLCAAIGGIKETEDDAACGGNCTIYLL